MQINLKTSQQNFPTLSPIFGYTPMLSPLPEDCMRKYSYNYDEFATFRLQPCQDQNYLLLEIQQMQQQHLPYQSEQNDKNEQNNSKKPQISQKGDKLPVSDHKSQAQQLIEAEIKSQNNQDSQKEPIQEYCSKNRISSPLENLILYLVRNINKDEALIKQQVLQNFQEKQTYSEIISVLLKKFKKTRKTKQEMVKYCMRKAFKFIADKMKKDRTHNRDIDTCMKMYFSKNHSSASFSIPFKKNSTQKTMNGSFLKRVFGSPNFLDDYKEFLHEFQELVEDDNFKKVNYLATLVDQCIKNGELKKIQGIKRLPWTQDTLDQTLELSKTLVQYADKDSPLCNPRRRTE